MKIENRKFVQWLIRNINEIKVTVNNGVVSAHLGDEKTNDPTSDWALLKLWKKCSPPEVCYTCKKTVPVDNMVFSYCRECWNQMESEVR
jgi:hypothetical protein